MTETQTKLLRIVDAAALAGTISPVDAALARLEWESPGRLTAAERARPEGIVRELVAAPEAAIKLSGELPHLGYAIKRRIRSLKELLNDQAGAEEPTTAMGGSVKALDGGKVGGWLVKFHSPDRSKWKDWFHAKTDYGRFIKGELPMLWHHSLRDEAGLQIEDEIGDLTISPKAEGLAVDGRMSLASPELRAIHANVKAGRASWSSGAVPHKTKRTPQPDQSNRLDTWWIVEGSLTGVPADPNATANVPIDDAETKAILEEADWLLACVDADALSRRIPISVLPPAERRRHIVEADNALADATLAVSRLALAGIFI